MPNPPAFIPAAFLMTMVPGPAAVMLIKQPAKGSRRNAFATVAGIEAGVAFWGLAAVFGLTALLIASQVAYDVLRIAGAVFLIHLGVKRSSSASATVMSRHPPGAASAPAS